ncbi:ABC transporter ATP-binding protein [Niallia sp. NCCP-28]|uniref:ABC transporter ATP-binding protein n=1 Tax=Niallia sp. NCCP-28 TaxID=2934712 RepID=UPI002083855D|nr:ABC transporter ATP-binding protein [Niallia sp. NCCP-28]GKU83538.1 ABC transporter ATP-binding protein [Niallia sp. NCCP-28]
MDNIVRLTNVSKVFADQKAVENISFSINKGEVVAILGANGAGKTTTILMMLGLVRPTDGEIMVFGKNPNRKEVKERIGCMLQEVSVMDSLKVKEIISLVQSYYPNSMATTDLLDITGFEKKDWNKRTEKLSGGQKRRLNFALALAGNPDLLFLDEPTVGMDITARKNFWDTVKRLKNSGKTIIFTTHYLQEADEVAERIILFKNGAIMEDGTPFDLKNRLSKQRISFQAGKNVSLDIYRKLPHCLEAKQVDDRVVLLTDQTDELLNVLFANKLSMTQIEVHQGNLEEALSELAAKREVM